MSESNPLAGLTEEQADERIEQFGERVKRMQESAKAAADHLKEMKSARKNLESPVPVEQQGQEATNANAQPATLTTEAGEL